MIGLEFVVMPRALQPGVFQHRMEYRKALNLSKLGSKMVEAFVFCYQVGRAMNESLMDVCSCKPMRQRFNNL